MVRGHHVYKRVWNPVNGEELCVIPEDNNNHDAHAIAVMKVQAGFIRGRIQFQSTKTTMRVLFEGGY